MAIVGKPINQQKAEELKKETKDMLIAECKNNFCNLYGGNSFLYDNSENGKVYYCSKCNELDFIPSNSQYVITTPLQYGSRKELICPSCRQRHSISNIYKRFYISTLKWSEEEDNVVIAAGTSTIKYPNMEYVYTFGLDTFLLNEFVAYKKRLKASGYFQESEDTTNYIAFYRMLSTLDDGIDTKIIDREFSKFSVEERVFMYLALKQHIHLYEVLAGDDTDAREVLVKYLHQCGVAYSKSIGGAVTLLNKVKLIVNKKRKAGGDVFFTKTEELKDMDTIEKADAYRKCLKNDVKNTDNQSMSDDLREAFATIGDSSLVKNFKNILFYKYLPTEETYDMLLKVSLLTGCELLDVSKNVVEFMKHCKNNNIPFRQEVFYSQSVFNITNIARNNKYYMEILEKTDNAYSYHQKYIDNVNKISCECKAEQTLFLANGDMAELVKDPKQVMMYSDKAQISIHTFVKIWEKGDAYIYTSVSDDLVYIINKKGDILLERRVA